MKTFLILIGFSALVVIAVIYPSISFSTENLSSEGKTNRGNLEKANELGEEFQRQMPWSSPQRIRLSAERDVPQSGAHEGTPQPEGYLFLPERKGKEAEPSAAEYPYCYNPYTRRYEYCPGGQYPYSPFYYYKNHFYLRLGEPKFYFYWEGGEQCPPGYYYSPGWGCYRY